MVQFLSIIFFGGGGFLQFLLGFSKVSVFLCHPVLNKLGFNVHHMTPYIMEDISRFLEKPATSIFYLEEERSRSLRIVDNFLPDCKALRNRRV